MMKVCIFVRPGEIVLMLCGLASIYFLQMGVVPEHNEDYVVTKDQTE